MQIDDVIDASGFEDLRHFCCGTVDGMDVIHEWAKAFCHRLHAGFGQKVHLARPVDGCSQTCNGRGSQDNVSNGGEPNDEYTCWPGGHATKLSKR